MVPSDATLPPRAYTPPTLLQTLGELRAFGEIGCFYGTRPLLKRLAPRGDGHPVMVLPGFMASDALTAAMRDFLVGLGYEVHAWELGRNPGLRHDLCCKLEERIAAIRNRTRRRVTLVGWSLGGLYARVIAHRQSDSIRQIITLGSPFNFSVAQTDSISGPAARLYQLLNPGHAEDPLSGSGLTERSPPVPSTSIFSQRDGIAPWRCCIDQCDEKTENIRVPGSHCGMTHNPFILHVVAERLAQREHAWKPFRASWASRLLFRPMCAQSALAAT